MKRRMLALAGALVLAACPLTACGESSADETSVVYDMPYGSMLTANTALPVSVQYDSRFLEDGLVQKISSYYHALQAQDAAEFTAAQLPFYHEYQLAEAGGDELTDDALVKLTYESIKAEYDGKDFDYSMVDVVEYIDADGQIDTRDAMLAMLDKIAEEKGEPKVSDRAEKFVQMSIDRYLCDKGSGSKRETAVKLDGELLFAVKLDGQWYLMYA